MMDIFKNPRYRGKHVILAAGKVYTAKTGEGASRILKKIRKEHPSVTPEVAYLPNARSLAFFDNDEVPALLGRLGFLETFDAEFTRKHEVMFKG